MNGRAEAAERVDRLHRGRGRSSRQDAARGRRQAKAIELQPTEKIGYLALTRVLFRELPEPHPCSARRAHDHPVVPVQRDLLHLHPGARQVLRRALATSAPLYLIAFAVGNLAGPLTIGHLFDTIGRRKMIAGTYVLSGRAAGRQRGPVRRRGAQRDHPDHRLVRHLLLRVGRGQRGLPDRERDLPAGGAGEGDRGVLRRSPSASGRSVRSSTARSSATAPNPSCCSWATCSARE